MRRFAILTILLTAIFFVVGWWPVQKGWLTQEQYLAASGIVGGIASIIGLLGLVRSPLTRRDFENVEWESVVKAAQSAQELQELETKKAKASDEIQQLSRTREELADLVKKASAVLFLREELDRSSQKLVAFVSKHKDLKKDLEDYRENSRRLRTLAEEIKQHPDAELIAEVMLRARSRTIVRRTEIIEALDRIPLFGPVIKFLLLVVDAYVRAVKILIRNKKG